MGWHVIVILGGGLVAVWLAFQNGRKAAQLEVLKEKIKMQAEEPRRAQEISNSVAIMDEHTVRQRLHEIANREH